MKKRIISLTLLLALLSSCDFVSKVTDAAKGSQMDGESTYTKAAELLGDVDSAWKVYSFNIDSEGMPDECKNEFGYMRAGMMNADGEVYAQNLYPFKSDPDIDNFAPKGATYDEIPTIDFNAEKAMKNVNDCKAKIPEGYSFLNLRTYQMKYDVKSKTFITKIDINVQEIGKESVNVNGKQSSVYYQLAFTITPDGKIEMEEK